MLFNICNLNVTIKCFFDFVIMNFITLYFVPIPKTMEHQPSELQKLPAFFLPLRSMSAKMKTYSDIFHFCDIFVIRIYGNINLILMEEILLWWTFMGL